MKLTIAFLVLFFSSCDRFLQAAVVDYGELVLQVEFESDDRPTDVFAVVTSADGSRLVLREPSQWSEICLPIGTYTVTVFGMMWKTVEERVSIARSHATVCSCMMVRQCSSAPLCFSSPPLVDPYQIGTVRIVDLGATRPNKPSVYIRWGCDEDAESRIEVIGEFPQVTSM